jgi:hypothetical protein
MVKQRQNTAHGTGLLEAVQLTFKRYACMWCATEVELVLLLSARQTSTEYSNASGTLA